MPDVTVKRVIHANLAASLGVEWELPADFLTFSHFLRVLGDVDFSSSPGYPYRLRAPSNSVFFKRRDDGVIPSDRLLEVWDLVELQIRERVSDPIYLFVKQEPHKKAKKGRKRLISSVSIIDQIIDQMLFSGFNQWLIDDAATGPVKAGWNIMAGGWKTLPVSGWSLDKKAWDWTVKPWALQMCLEFRRSTLKSGPHDALWYSLASWRYWELFYNARFALPDGSIHKQLKPGIMKSGCVNTIADNSLMQLILHFRVCAELEVEPGWIWALGDDTRQQTPRDKRSYLDRLNQYALVKQDTELCEFAGYRYTGGNIEPLYRGKHAFNMLYCDPTIQADIARSYSLLYHRSKQSAAINSILAYLGNPLNKEFRDYLWDSDV